MSGSIDGITKNFKSTDLQIKGDGKVYIKNYTIGKPGMLLIHASWCGHCVRFKPTYMQLSKMLNNNAIHFPCYAIESNELSDSRLSKALDFRGFPSIKYINQNGKIIDDYKGGRDIDSLTKDICNMYHKLYKDDTNFTNTCKPYM